MASVEKVIGSLQEENKATPETEEIQRLGRYKEGEHRPMKIRFRSQTAAKDLLGKASKLARIEEFKQIWIKRDRTREERTTISELRNEANEKKDQRSEVEKKNFYWRVIDMRLKKWYKREEKQEGED